ncbi:hypothetical protein [Streptomyces sp. NPDC058045]|uniref:hypothetical protein n=1 Tax=Streptomyces sp. NPDC058045 TaxID=3346311 RepID=UPI0036EF7291
MSEITGTGSGARSAAVHESYSFACMRCGHGWEQSYEIRHRTDADGEESVVYLADGKQVPSPLTRPTCQNCGGHVVRIMGAGRVSSARNSAYWSGSATRYGTDPGGSGRRQRPASGIEPGIAGPVGSMPSDWSGGPTPAELMATGSQRVGPAERSGDGRHWHLADLLHPFRGHKD